MFFMSPAARSLNHLLRNVETDNLPNAPGDRNGIDAGTAAEIQNAALVSQYAGSLENLQKTVVVETCGRRSTNRDVRNRRKRYFPSKTGVELQTFPTLCWK